MSNEVLKLKKELLTKKKNYIKDDIQDIVIQIENKIESLKIIKNELSFNIIISNYTKNYLDILKEVVVDILKEEEMIKGDIVEYSKNLNLYSIPYNSLIILDDIDEFKEDHYKYEEKIEMLYRKNTHFLYLTSKCLNDDKVEDDLISKFIINFEGEKMDKVDILKEIKSLYKENSIDCKLNDKFLLHAIDSYLEENPNENIELASKMVESSLKQMVLLNQDFINEKCFFINKKDKNNIMELNKMIGLSNVKKEIKELTNFLEFRKKLNNFNKMYLNLFFMGNAGTGKTTVARIYTHILYELGYIKEDKIIEIVPNDLMGNYVGQTKDTTRKILDKAKNGVLFIDEAYLINQSTYLDGFSSYMKEAIVELLKYLEDSNNVVIFSGYTNEMKKIYDVNPGIKSRIYKELYFDDYTNNELYSILKNNLEKLGIVIDKNAKEEIIKILEKERKKVNFGNARFTEKFMQMILINHANRKLKNETFTISKEDVFIQDSIDVSGFFKENV